MSRAAFAVIDLDFVALQGRLNIRGEWTCEVHLGHYGTLMSWRVRIQTC
jgi:hypothetical protein